jgi:hypothetical protein
VKVVRPKTRRTLRALAGRRIIVESFGARAPTFVAIAGGTDTPASAWITHSELRKLVELGKKILK